VTGLTIGHHTLETSQVLVLTGDLDLKTAEEFHDVLRALPLDEGQLLVIDLARVEFCDSSGLAALVAARNHALTAHAAIALAAVPRPIVRMLRILGLDTAFPTHPTSQAWP
jgi:anti-sigma B factor antagonist